MKKIMYLHGFASSGASGTVGLLRHELWDKDDTSPAAQTQSAFEEHYPGMSRVFPGGHRLNADVVTHTLLPFIRELGVLEAWK